MSLEFSWSVSRHDTFMTCKRRYYYAYYASQDDPEIYRLKKLSALPLWAGSTVHDAIERLLKSRDHLPSPIEQEAMVRAVVHSQMVTDWRDSTAGSLRFRLFEHEYDAPVQQEDKKIVVTTVVRALRHFFRSDTLREAYAAGREQWLSVEDLVSYELGSTNVFVRMDLAFRNRAGEVVIVDWKTGRTEGRFNHAQLAGYALYAHRQGWVSRPEELHTELAYLAMPRFVRRQVDARTLDEVRRFIERSVAAMKSLLVDPVANRARLEDFPMIERPQVCRRCNFRRLCFPRETVPVTRPNLSAPPDVP